MLAILEIGGGDPHSQPSSLKKFYQLARRVDGVLPTACNLWFTLSAGMSVAGNDRRGRGSRSARLQIAERLRGRVAGKTEVTAYKRHKVGADLGQHEKEAPGITCHFLLARL
jgi:hypothetical protein